jgi:hypothetical protein
MTHNHPQMFRLAPLIAALALTLPLRADDPIETHWNQLCRVANGRELVVTTTSGEKIEGACFSISLDEMTVTTKGNRAVKIARNALAKVAVHRSKGRQLAALGRGLNESFHNAEEMTFSPLAPIGLVMFPGTAAWGAVAAPFCLLGDLKDRLNGTREIQLK